MGDIAEKIGRKVFSKHIQQYTPADPLYETYTDKRGRTKRRKRELPPGLSDEDARILRSIKRRAHYLDKGFRVCGMRFGWTFVIGLIPGAGDVADAALGYFLIVRKSRQAGCDPAWLTQRMLLNLGIATSIGLVPIEFLRLRGAGLAQEQTTSGAVDKAIAARRRARGHDGAGRGDEPEAVREAAESNAPSPRSFTFRRRGGGGKKASG
ncbi:hypothetical protein BC834DRAFT_882920 [Gloeopeniophorella convolvens]|nr:hypothetical protein BC834DRAFT_882920 [Gloeopeniophorella convolvens]